ncbi:MAG: hypothetical protein A3K03_03635 [Bdellovibrionales bacterium RIFOXYD1_FULL_44_7]|nr:MAG: hypothetical protein A3K03_03635 [Bdellovibrionales bacterium RIFOXYD1_FULL_44_7]
MTQFTITPSELQLLRKEIEAMGDFLSADKIERQADNALINLRLDAMLSALDILIPDFKKQYEQRLEDNKTAKNRAA